MLIPSGPYTEEIWIYPIHNLPNSPDHTYLFYKERITHTELRALNTKLVTKSLLKKDNSPTVDIEVVIESLHLKCRNCCGY